MIFIYNNIVLRAKSDLQVSNGVSFSQLYLEDLQSADVGSQTGQALLTTATHADKQGVASRGLKDTVDTTPTVCRKTLLRNWSNSSYRVSPHDLCFNFQGSTLIFRLINSIKNQWKFIAICYWLIFTEFIISLNFEHGTDTVQKYMYTALVSPGYKRIKI
jgi:hypothetical protein